MLKIKCDICQQELDRTGALLFSPPDKNGIVRKYHICYACFQKLINEYKLADPNPVKSDAQAEEKRSQRLR